MILFVCFSFTESGVLLMLASAADAPVGLGRMLTCVILQWGERAMACPTITSWALPKGALELPCVIWRGFRACRHSRQCHLGRTCPYARWCRHQRRTPDVRLSTAPLTPSSRRDARRDRRCRALFAFGPLHRRDRGYSFCRLRVQHHHHASSFHPEERAGFRVRPNRPRMLRNDSARRRNRLTLD